MRVFLVVMIGCLASATAFAESPTGDRGTDDDVTYPPALLIQNGGPILDVTHPPEEGMHAAVGDGTTDDTAAFQDAYDWLRKKYEAIGWTTTASSYFFYIPNGTYLVRDTILYRGAAVKWSGQYDVCHVRFLGQSRAKTILKLADRSPLFQDPAHPRPVLAYQHPDTGFNNGAAGNFLRNVTIDTGSGNPGAAGVMFQGANQTDIRDVTIRSDDGAGRYGIWFRIGSVQGYYSDVTVEGFDYGIEDLVTAEGDPAFEYLTLRGQRAAAIHLSGGGLSLRKFLSDQAAHGVPALKIEGTGAQAVLVDSELRGGASASPAVDLAREEGECLFARNVAAAGYGSAVRRSGKEAVAAPRIEEYCTSPAKVLFDGQRTASLNLPVEDAPAVSWGDPATDWAIVDDPSEVQAALDSGKPVVCFKRRAYKLAASVTVPATVRVLAFMGADVDGTFVVNQPSDAPLLAQDGAARIQIEAKRDFIGHCYGRNVLNPKGLPLTFFLENVNDTASGDLFCQTGQKVYARQIDVEYRNVPQIVCNGGTMWIFGFKTEDKGTAAPFIVKKGGALEILGGYVNMLSSLVPSDAQAPIIANLDSSASVTCFTNMTGLFQNGVKETRAGETRAAVASDFPLRGGQYKRNYVIPLYVGAKP